jgi:drug/metabolite transporter (DMT)-like permease
MVAVMGAGAAGGLLAAAVAGASYDTAYALQALEARAVDARHALRASLLGRLVRRPRWLAAGALSLAGGGLQLLALAHAPLTLVQPALVLGLLLLLYLGGRMLDERVGSREVAGALAIIAGVCALAVGAPPRTAAPVPGAGLVLALGALAALALAPYLMRGRHLPPPGQLIAGAGAADAWAAIAAKLISDDIVRGEWLAVLGWGAGAVAALVVSLTSEMTALQRRPATSVAPVVVVLQVVVPVALAPLVLGERWGGTPLGGGLLAAGLVCAAAGAWVLGRSPAVGDLLASGAEALEDHRRRR